MLCNLGEKYSMQFLWIEEVVKKPCESVYFNKKNIFLEFLVEF